jgi:hypothetical protein
VYSLHLIFTIVVCVKGILADGFLTPFDECSFELNLRLKICIFGFNRCISEVYFFT